MKNKNITIDFILCFSLGYLGVHKFYEGNKNLGIIYLCTLGIFGIGWLIDIVILFLAVLKHYSSTDVNDIQTNNSNTSTTKETIDVNGIKISFYEPTYTERKKSLYSKTKTNKFVDDYVVFDLETTGLTPEDNEIIEISALKYKNNVLIDEFSKLVKPSISIPSKITKLTGITNEDVANCNTIDEVLPKFIGFIENYTLVAHNGSFDFSFIEKYLNELNIDYKNNSNIDTLYLARKYLPELDNHKLETLKEYFKLDNVSHRATADCETTNTVYQYCKSKQLDKIS